MFGRSKPPRPLPERGSPESPDELHLLLELEEFECAPEDEFEFAPEDEEDDEVGFTLLEDAAKPPAPRESSVPPRGKGELEIDATDETNAGAGTTILWE